MKCRRLLSVWAGIIWIYMTLMAVQALAEEARWPQAAGAASDESGKLLVDAGNAADGYILAGVAENTSHRMKLRVSMGEMTLTYDLNGEGNYEVFPLQLGSGVYNVNLYENVAGNKYSQAGSITLDVQLSREDAPFLYPNQYVNYTPESPIVPKSEELLGGKNPQEAYQAVCDFMQSSFLYDYVRAVTVSAGDLPDINGSYEKKMGICQDLSAIMVGMLRLNGIPARLMIGYADDNYHAWTLADVSGKEQFFDPTAALNAIAQPKTYTVERYY